MSLNESIVAKLTTRSSGGCAKTTLN